MNPPEPRLDELDRRQVLPADSESRLRFPEIAQQSAGARRLGDPPGREVLLGHGQPGERSAGGKIGSHGRRGPGSEERQRGLPHSTRFARERARGQLLEQRSLSEVAARARAIVDDPLRTIDVVRELRCAGGRRGKRRP